MNRIVVAACVLGLVGLARADLPPAHAGDRAAIAGGDLIGTWRLRAIEYRGPHGETLDPYYQAGSTGLLIYAASGWMSVQITAPDRKAWDLPERRVPPPGGPRNPRSGSALVRSAFDSYYAYYGRWEFDPAAALVTHHVEASLIPSEVGRSYAQSVSFEGDRLVFTNRGEVAGGSMQRRKIWERMPAPH